MIELIDKIKALEAENQRLTALTHNCEGMPRVGNLCLQSWIIFNRIKTSKPTMRFAGDIVSECLQTCVFEGLHYNTCRTEFYKWCKFNNIPKRTYTKKDTKCDII